MSEFETLETTLTAVWSRLEHGAKGDGPANLVSLATARLEGGASSRMMVLREVDREAATVSLFTHATSAKIAELSLDETAEILVWDAETQLQVRLTVDVAIAQGDQETWEGMGDGSKLNYARDPLPTTPLDDPDDADPTPDIAFFRRLTARIVEIDALTLSTRPHRRARFAAADGFKGQWIAP